ncbi:hypothetical protein GD627_09640 [Arthrobacter yangruifuii]|uniref:Uncharacterized protein n=1 Tax=Arthrobacter yangruifuii TaxID=2606616 RepID=A0A5N6MHU4_9MICC|nr:hypothetical protein [Arthrobacter yangruifuii]KAD3633092.1 hypothetical protein GD627_09640 [Arthrobacter yangruifuii]
MKNNFGSGMNGDADRAGARETLDALSNDRLALAERVKTPPWYYPLLGVATVFIIGSPGVEQPSRSVLVAFGVIALVALTVASQKKTGVTINRTAGPRSLGIAVTLGVAVAFLLGVSLTLESTGHEAWIALTAAVAFLAVWLLGRLYDRAYYLELRSGR